MTTPRTSEEALVDGLLRALAIFRLVALVWAIVGVVLQRDQLISTAGAVALIAVMVVTTALVTPSPAGAAILPTRRWPGLLVELTAGVVVLLGDGFVFSGDRAVSFAWSWPAAGVIAAGIIFGTRAGLSTALVAGFLSLFTDRVLLERDAGLVGGLSKVGLWAVTGAIAGYVVTRLRRAEREISLARTREIFARELHDGVLQTLAVIQRRSSDTELSALARDQEHELRSFLSSSPTASEDGDRSSSLEPELRSLAARHERLYADASVQVVVANDLPLLPSASIDALAGAVGEALTNAGKHGGATKITVYAEPTEDGFIELPPQALNASVFVSVKDNGSGFDPDTAVERIGLKSSIRGRIDEAGGHSAITGQPGQGAEVQLWL